MPNDLMLRTHAGAPPQAPLPSNIEAEAALLGAMMTPDMGWLVEFAADRMTAAAFFEPLHGDIYEAIQRQHSLGRSTSPVLIKSYFEADDPLKPLGGVKYLAMLTGVGDGLLSPRDLVDQVADLAQRRKIMTALSEAFDECSDITADVAGIVSRIDGAIDHSLDGEDIESDAAECAEAFLANLDTETIGVTCRRIGQLDDLLGQLEPKSMTAVGARPGMGKTAWALNYSIGAAESGHGVCYVSLEMPRDQLMGRIVADASFDDADRRVPYKAIQRRTLNPWQRERVNDLAGCIAKLPFTIVDTGTLTVGKLERIVRSQKRRYAARGKQLELLVIDYLQLLRTDEKMRSPYETVSEISRRLKALAKDHDIAVVALVQLNRAVDARQDHRPILSDLRDSGQIEQDADAIMFLLREEEYIRQREPQNDPDEYAKWETDLERHRGVIEFILAKCRHGTTGVAKGKFFGVYQAIR